MDWTLTTERTAWELAAAVAILVGCGVGASAFLKTLKIVAVLRFCLLLAAATLLQAPQAIPSTSLWVVHPLKSWMQETCSKSSCLPILILSAMTA